MQFLPRCRLSEHQVLQSFVRLFDQSNIAVIIFSVLHKKIERRHDVRPSSGHLVLELVYGFEGARKKPKTELGSVK